METQRKWRHRPCQRGRQCVSWFVSCCNVGCCQHVRLSCRDSNTRRFVNDNKRSYEQRKQAETRWLYCVECPRYSTRLEALGYLCDCLSGLWTIHRGVTITSFCAGSNDARADVDLKLPETLNLCLSSPHFPPVLQWKGCLVWVVRSLLPRETDWSQLTLSVSCCLVQISGYWINNDVVLLASLTYIMTFWLQRRSLLRLNFSYTGSIH